MAEPLSPALNRGKWTPETAPRGGRPKGAVNKATREIREIARGLLEDPEYQDALRQRLIAGMAERMEALLFLYAYGKPKESPDPRQLEPELDDETYIERAANFLAGIPLDGLKTIIAEAEQEKSQKTMPEFR